MAQSIGRLGSLGIGIENTPGTPVSASIYIPYTEITVREHHTPLPIVSAFTSRITDSNSVVGKKWGEGDFGIVADVVNSGYLWKAALGNENMSGSNPTSHLFYTTVSGNAPTTMTLIQDRTTDQIQYAYAAVEKLDFTFKDGLADMKCTIKSQAPTVGGAQTVTTTSGTFLSFKDASFKLGTNLGSLGSTTAINEFSLSIVNNLDLIYQSGSNSPTIIRTKNVNITGNFSKLFDDVVERNAYTALTKRAFQLTLTGNANESLRIQIPQFRVESDITTALDQFFMVKSNFTVEDDVDGTGTRFIDVLLQNNKTSVY